MTKIEGREEDYIFNKFASGLFYLGYRTLWLPHKKDNEGISYETIANFYEAIQKYLIFLAALALYFGDALLI